MSDWSASGMISLCSVFLVLSVASVALRFYARFQQKAPILIDDWLMIPALATFIACAVITIYLVTPLKVYGYSSFSFTKEEMAKMAEQAPLADALNVVTNLLTVICLGCIKSSALFFYKRIFCVADRKATLNIIIIVSLVVMALWVIAFELMIGFQCHTHLDSIWNGNYVKECTYSFPVLLGQAISDAILDVWVLVLPIPSLISLQTTKSRRFAIGGIFALACIGLGSSIARLVIIIESEYGGKSAFVTNDLERILTRSFFYIMLEIGVALVAVNLPSIWIVFASMTPESVLRSVRSVISLSSLRSKRSAGSANRTHDKALRSNASSSSVVPIAITSAESYELGTLGAKHEVPAGQIQVSRSVYQTSNGRKYEEV